jgi:Ca2+-binding RTX toxin-like protein
MPSGGLPKVYAGPVGTTGTGLDALIQMIGEDIGLINNISATQIREGAAAADKLNHIIVDAIKATGAMDDGHLTVAEVFDISDYIHTNNLAAFKAAHGEDANMIETGFHLVRGNHGASYLLGDSAIDTVMDGIYHIGFETKWDRFLNEDGNANARVETVTYWLNELLGGTPLPAPGPGTSPFVGSASSPNVTVINGLNVKLAADASSLTLKGLALNGIGNSGDNTITGNDQANMLEGRAGNDKLVGGAGADVLMGGDGKDTMIGGTGDDIYWVDNAGDIIKEADTREGGIDLVNLEGSDLVAYTLVSGLENAVAGGDSAIKIKGNALANTISAGAGADRIDGLGGDDTLSGGGGNDALYGGAGNDMLNGGEGSDILAGGLGNDRYAVDAATDKVIEKADGGYDTVYSSVSYHLGKNLEDLILGGNAVNAVGNALANHIEGNGGDNRINGRAGADSMAGMGGNDVYIADNAGDTVTEKAGEGIDRVESSVGFVLGDFVETLLLTGDGNINGSGNSMLNTLTGNGGNNVLTGFDGDDLIFGKAGNDTLVGSNGADTLTGGAGSDRFVFATLAESTAAPSRPRGGAA